MVCTKVYCCQICMDWSLDLIEALWVTYSSSLVICCFRVLQKAPKTYKVSCSRGSIKVRQWRSRDTKLKMDFSIPQFDFTEDMLKKQKNIMFRGAGASYQNGAGERAINMLVIMERTMFMYSVLICTKDTLFNDFRQRKWNMMYGYTVEYLMCITV